MNRQTRRNPVESRLQSDHNCPDYRFPKAMDASDSRSYPPGVDGSSSTQAPSRSTSSGR